MKLHLLLNQSLYSVLNSYLGKYLTRNLMCRIGQFEIM